ncbi:hypothetical protein RJ639_033217 [Escallonia herrerae]|uniref:Uncharacterized protein n=1 Tax=Escallonia herrerae TaxID=1293975 RepID=A0AA89BIR7_9ASTE|nr:hypothetical protein RJ639_033217 [Escallonia herrerae]
MEVTDKGLTRKEDGKDMITTKGIILALMELGLECSKGLPDERSNIKEVVIKLSNIRSQLICNRVYMCPDCQVDRFFYLSGYLKEVDQYLRISDMQSWDFGTRNVSRSDNYGVGQSNPSHNQHNVNKQQYRVLFGLGHSARAERSDEILLGRGHLAQVECSDGTLFGQNLFCQDHSAQANCSDGILFGQNHSARAECLDGILFGVGHSAQAECSDEILLGSGHSALA